MITWLVLAFIIFAGPACRSSEPTPPPPPSPTAVPAVSPTSAPPTSEPQAATATPAAAVTPDEAAPARGSAAILPAPLYFLNPAGQIVRLEVNGLTLTPITTESEPVTTFDISPDGNRLAYVSNNSLIVSDTSGANRTVRLAGEPLSPDSFGQTINKAIDNLHFAPDGNQLAFGFNGVNLISVIGDSQPELIQASDPVPDATGGNPPGQTPIRFFWPEAWSPDGSKLLIRFAYYPEGGGFMVKNFSDGALLELSPAESPLCCHPAWDRSGNRLYFASDITQFANPGLWLAEVDSGTVTRLFGGQAAQSGDPLTLISFPHASRDGALLAFVVQTEDELYAPNPTLHRLSPDGTLTPLRQDHYTVGDLAWAGDDSGAVIVDITRNRQFPIRGPLVWLPVDGRPALDLPAFGSLPRWGGPAQAVTERPWPTAGDFATLEAMAQANFGLELAATGTEFSGIEGISIRQINTGAELRSFWVVFTEGLRSYEPEQGHLLAIYAFDQNGWQEVARLALNTGSEPDAIGPDYLGEGSVSQVFVEPSRSWLAVEGGAGAHSGIFQLLSFDGQSLRLEATNFNSSPGAGGVADLNGDGVLEVLLDLTDPYIFYYAAGVRLVHYDVLAWDATAAQLVPVELTPLPEDAPPAVRNWNDRALALASVGLWKDAQLAIDEARVQAPADEQIAWNQALIRLNAEAKRDVFSPYPLLDQLFYGDYAAAVEVMRAYSAEEIFMSGGPLLTGTVAEGSEEILSEIIQTSASNALDLQPELAPAYFLRGWATFLKDPASPAALSDVERAVELAPDDPLFTAGAELLRNRQ
jgi:hypothetical protein